MKVKEVGSSKPEAPNGAMSPPPQAPKMSKAIPFMKTPKHLDGTLAGDVGFDPLGFADSKSNLLLYREAEIKHARLAMLAAAGWPVSELFDGKIAKVLGMQPVLGEGGRVPSVLNGGMDKISPVYWVGCVALAAAVEAYALAAGPNKYGIKDDAVSGNLGFDPLGLYPKKEKDQKWMQTAEIKNGRLAMLAITGFAFQEFVTHIAVVDETPIFFRPIWDVLNNMVPGYIVPDDVDIVSTSMESVMTPPTDAAATASVEAALNALKTPTDAAVTTSMESVTTPPVDAVTTPPVVPPTDAAAGSDILASATNSAPPAPAASSDNYADELTAAKQKIADLESKLAAINDLVR